LYYEVVYLYQEVDTKYFRKGEKNMKDWVQLLTAAIQCYTAYLLLKDKKKGTKKRRVPRKRK
jgi:hypothetical protein